MTHKIHYRTAQLTPGDGRTVYGLAVPYGQVATVSDGDGRPYREMFQQGSFDRSIRERGSKVRLLVGHDHRRLPIGKALTLEERSDGLYCEFVVSDTADGRDALTAIRDGLVTGFSVGFAGIKDRWDDNGTLVRTECALREVSLTAFPAYCGATVGGVRSSVNVSPFVHRARVEAWLDTLNW